MINDDNKVIVEKLEKLAALLDESLVLKDYIDSGCAREYSDKITEEIEKVKTLPGTPSVFKNIPCFPKGYDETQSFGEKYSSQKRTFTFIIAIAAILIVAYFISHIDFLNTLASAGMILSVIYLFIFLQSKSKYITAKKAYDKSTELSKESLKNYEYALAKYEKEKEDGIEIAKKFKNEFLSVHKKHLALADEYADAKDKAMKKFISNIEEARTIDFVPEEYYHLVKNILNMLKSGRADNYKEALNLAIKEEKEAEIEAARRAEEARRTQLMREQVEAEQRRAEEMERHNRELENQQILQAKMAADNQRKAEKEAAKANMKAELLGRSKCTNCANASKCPSHIKSSGAGLNCGGYRPR